MSNLTYRSPRLLRATFIQLHSQQKAGIFCDVILQAEGEGISAHACVLSACSPFFTECLTDIKPGGQLTHVKLPGIMPSTLHKLVHYLYTSELEMTRAEVGEVLAAARKLRIPELEVLQLQGTKLVRTDSWPRLNRKCFQASDQNRLEASDRAMVPLEVKEPPPQGQVEEKYAAAVFVVEPSTRLSETLTLERSCPSPVDAKDRNKMHIDSKPTDFPCSGGNALIPNSPDRQTWICLGPVPDSSSSVEGGGPTVQKIKLTRLKNSAIPNSPLRPTPAKTGSCTTSVLKGTLCEGTAVKVPPNKCLHNGGSGINCSSTSCAQKDPMQTQIKPSVSKSVSSSVWSQSPSSVRSKASMYESSMGQSNIAGERQSSQEAQNVQPVTNLVQLPIHVSADVLSPTSIQKDRANRRPTLSRKFCSTPAGENRRRRLRIINGSPQSETAQDSQPIEHPSDLLTRTLSADRDHQDSNITNRSSQSQGANNTHPTEDLVQSSICEHSAILSPLNNEPEITMRSLSPCVGSSEDSRRESHIVQSNITNRSTQSHNALKQPPMKCLPTRQTPERGSQNTICGSKQSLTPCSHEGPAPSLLKSSMKSGLSTSGVSGNTLKRKRSFRKPAITCEALGTKGASKAQAIVGAEPPESSKQFMPLRDMPQSSNSVSECEEQIEVVLSVLDTIKPQSETNTSSHPPAITPTLPPIQDQEFLPSRPKRCSSDLPKVVKKQKQEEAVQTSGSSKKNNGILPDGINSMAMKQKKHNMPHANHTRHHKDVLLPDGTLRTKGHKQHRLTDKTVASFKKKRCDDHPRSKKDKDAHKIGGTRTVCSPAPFPVNVNSDSKAGCLKESVKGNWNSNVAVSSGVVDGSAALASDCLLHPVNGPCLSGEEEDIDVGGMEWTFISDIPHTCFRPDPSSESEPEVNIVD